MYGTSKLRLLNMVHAIIEFLISVASVESKDLLILKLGMFLKNNLMKIMGDWIVTIFYTFLSLKGLPDSIGWSAGV